MTAPLPKLFAPAKTVDVGHTVWLPYQVGDGLPVTPDERKSTTTQPHDPNNVVTPAEQLSNVPGYSIELNTETFKYEASPVTDGGPTCTGSLERCLRFVAAEQGWSPEQLEATVAYNEVAGFTG